MGTTTTAFMTFEEFERLPDEPNCDLELLDGELIRMSYPEVRHMESAERLYDLLKAAIEPARAAGARLGKVHIEMGYRLSNRSGLRADVSITHPDQPRDRFYQGAPMLVFEILSPSQTVATMDRRVKEYLKCGALEVWMLHADDRYAVVRDSAGGVRVEDRAIRSPHLPGIEIPFDQFL